MFVIQFNTKDWALNEARPEPELSEKYPTSLTFPETIQKEKISALL